MTAHSTALNRCRVLGLLLIRIFFWGCRSDDQHPAARSAAASGALLSVPPGLPTDDAATPYKVSTTLHENDLSRKAAALDGGLVLLPPTPLREDSRVPEDTPSARDATGITFEAEWKGSDWPAPPNAVEIDRERLAEIQRDTRWSIRLDLVASGRMRLVLTSRGFAFEKGTELRSRVDLFGHFLVWPDQNKYRVLSPGTIRSLFEEGRADVGSALVVAAKPAGTGRWLDWDTERISLTNAYGRLTLDQATIPTAGAAGRLLCRWLVEFISADPSTAACQTDSVPVHALFDFAGGGQGEFVVAQVSKKQEYLPSSISVPPSSASVNSKDLPRATRSGSALLSGLRNRALPHNQAALPAKMTGLLAVNRTMGLRALLIDGIAAGWLWPGEARSMPELLPGVYSIAWRDFFGLSREAPKSVTLPAQVSVGNPPEPNSN